VTLHSQRVRRPSSFLSFFSPREMRGLSPSLPALTPNVWGHRRSHSRIFFFFFSLVTGPRSFLSLTLIDTRVYEPQIRSNTSPSRNIYIEPGVPEREMVQEMVPEREMAPLHC